MPLQVLICMSNDGVGEMLRLLLHDAGYIATTLNLFDWLEGITCSDLPPDIIFVDAWPLRRPEAAKRAQGKLDGSVTGLILLIDGSETALLAQQLGASATLPLLFSRNELVTVMAQACQVIPPALQWREAAA